MLITTTERESLFQYLNENTLKQNIYSNLYKKLFISIIIMISYVRGLCITTHVTNLSVKTFIN